MPMLLLSKQAKKPYYLEPLGVRITSREELSWLILEYPLLAFTGFVSEDLIRWIGEGLGMEEFSARLAAEKKAGERDVNLVLEILSAGNYATQAEVRAYRDRLLTYKNATDAKMKRETARMYLAAGRDGLAEELLSESAEELQKESLTFGTEGEKERIRRDLSDTLCDLVCVRMLRSDKEGALSILDSLKEAGRFQRAEEYRYLLTGDADLSDAEKSALSEKKKAAYEAAVKGESCRRLKEISALTKEDFLGEAGKMLSEWKDEYRKTY